MNRITRTLVLASLAVSLATTTDAAGDWLQWGGPNGDFTIDSTEITDSWPEGGPPVLWKRPLGDGYSAVLYKKKRLYTMYREDNEEIVVAIDAGNGKTLWEHRYARDLWPEMVHQFGLGPNATPAIVGERLVSIGIGGQVRCLDLATGRLIWQHDLAEEFGRRRRMEEYGYSQSPLVHEGKIIVEVGGKETAVVAFAPDDGAVVWKSGPGGVSYAPASLLTLAGREHFIYFEQEGVVALDPSNGKLLWRSHVPVDNGNHLTPVVKCDDNTIWVGSQFLSAGGRLIRIEADGEGLAAKQLWYEKRLRTSHWTMLRLGDYIYGSTGGNDVSFLTGFNWKTGETAWRERGFHKAQGLYVDGKWLFLDESGQLVIARPSPQGLALLARAQMTEADSWTLPTLVSGTLYLRDRKTLQAVDLSRRLETTGE